MNNTENIITGIVAPILIICLVFIFTNITINNKQKTEIALEEFRDAVKVVRVEKEKNLKIIHLGSDIISTCVNGKKVIIVNGIIYYSGTVDTWGDIKGVDCE